MNRGYCIFTLSNGMRCVHAPATGQVSYVGLAIGAGSRDEGDDRQGLAHFVEHTIFKGTRHRRAHHISNRMESIGGELNAYTSKEETLVYTNAPAGYLKRSIELLSDLIAFNSFPEREVARERQVVIEEIHSYLDSPADNVYDLFDDRIYAGSAMGHNILGTAESVRSLGSEDCRQFLAGYYVPAEMVLYVVDNSPTSEVERLAEKYFGFLNFPAPKRIIQTPEVLERFDSLEDEGGYQAHTLMGKRVCGRNDDRRFPLFLLNNIIAGPCMNSRLNQELREKRGLVYSVDSTLALMSDCGLFQIYFGCEKDAVKRCRRIVSNLLEELASRRLSDKAFHSARRQYAGQLLVSGEHRESMAMSLGKSLLFYNEIHGIEYSRDRIMGLTAEQVRAEAERLLSSGGLSVLTIC